MVKTPTKSRLVYSGILILCKLKFGYILSFDLYYSWDVGLVRVNMY